MDKPTMQAIIRLLETMEEGILYIQGKIKQQDIEATLTVLTDIIGAFTQIEKNIKPSDRAI